MAKNDFVIKDGWLDEYKGKSTDVVIPENVTAFNLPAFLGMEEPFTLTLSNAMTCSFQDLISPGLSVLNIPAGTKFECSNCAPNNSPFLAQLKQINVEPENESCASVDGILYSKDMTTLYACPAAYEGDVVIPATVTTIAERAFYGCKLLKQIVVPDSVTSIGNRAFADCKSLKKLILPGNLSSFGAEVFLRCAKLTSAGPKGSETAFDLIFPWIEEIPDEAFLGMQKLKTVLLPASIKKVGKNAFKNCKALSDLTMPKSAQVAKNTFNGCVNLGDITYTDAETPAPSAPTEKPAKAKKAAKPEFAIANGMLIKYNGHDANVVIPEGIVTIGKRAFYQNMDIVSVVIPEGVETIEPEAFYWCPRLGSISFPDSVKKIGSNAFEPELLGRIVSAVPLRLFTKAALYYAVEAFSNGFPAMDTSTDVYKENLACIGGNLKAGDRYGTVHRLLMFNAPLRHAVFEVKAISVKDADWFLEQLNPEKDTAIIAELLEYKNTLLQDPKEQKKQAAAKKKKEEKALATEMTPADWKKIFKFSYANGDIVIKETKVREEVITVPSCIGTKKVRILDSRALFFGRWYNLDAISPKAVIISEGIEEIRSGAISCVKNADVYIPSTVTALPEYALSNCKDIVVHLPATLTEISEEFCDENSIKAIQAPAGSYAETFAKENDIPFIAE